MEYDAMIIGGGLAGLTAGSLLAKNGLKVAVIEKRGRTSNEECSELL